jgi:hypothetical protein
MTWNKGVRVDVPISDSGLMLLSVSRLSSEFGMARETVAKRLALAGAEPCDYLNGYAVYRLIDVCGALVDRSAIRSKGEANITPTATAREGLYQTIVARASITNSEPSALTAKSNPDSRPQ